MKNHHKVNQYNIPKLCAITLPYDPHLLKNIETALKEGIKWIQYRAKDKSRKELYIEALKIKELTVKYNALLTINDYVDVAMVIGAQSIHLGQDDFPFEKARQITSDDMIIGLSTHSILEVKEAERLGANYIGFGSIFMTDTKQIDEPKGVEILKDILNNVSIPVVAIGGINPHNIEQLLDAGKPICSIAMSSGIFRGNVLENCKNLARLNLIPDLSLEN